MSKKSSTDTGLSRRSFVTGAGMLALAAGGAGLVGCAPTSKGTASAAQDSAASDTLTADVLDRTWSFEVPPEPVSDDEIVETITADVVVIGSGMSGLCTAASALESGADVIVVTAGSIPVARGGSNYGIGSKYQKELGLDVTPETSNHIIRMTQYVGSLRVDQKKWARWINNSAESMDWMIDLMAGEGLNVGLERGYDDPAGFLTSLPSSHFFWNDENPNGTVNGAEQQVNAYASFFEKNGGTIHWNTPARYLIRENDNTGRVSAVIAQRSESGDYVKFEAKKAVVLATGDFTRDKEMMAKYSPAVYRKYHDSIPWGEVDYDALSVPFGQFAGDGHKMALWVGAAWQKVYPCAPMETCVSIPFPSTGEVTNFLGINLASDGKRFMNECTSVALSADSIANVAGDKVFYVWDSIYANIHDEWHAIGAAVGGATLTPEEEVATWDAKVEEGTWFRADTIDELLAQLSGLDAKAAKASIESLNAYCEQGYDEEFQVDPSILKPILTPPFYGSFLEKDTSFMLLTTCGGLRCNEKMQVCDDGDAPIDGLYCTGIMTGDFYSNTYSFSIFGQNLGGVCCTLSYLLGRDLALL